MMRITRIEEYSLGTARPTFQGHAKLGFREDGRLLAADLYVVQENGPDIGGGDFRSAGKRCRSSISRPRCASGRSPF